MKDGINDRSAVKPGDFADEQGGGYADVQICRCADDGEWDDGGMG
jgi:hypothetical protein